MHNSTRTLIPRTSLPIIPLPPKVKVPLKRHITLPIISISSPASPGINNLPAPTDPLSHYTDLLSCAGSSDPLSCASSSDPLSSASSPRLSNLMRGHKKRHSHSGSHGFHVEVLREVDEISSPILKGVYRPQSHYLNSFLSFFSPPSSASSSI